MSINYRVYLVVSKVSSIDETFSQNLESRRDFYFRENVSPYTLQSVQYDTAFIRLCSVCKHFFLPPEGKVLD